MTIQNIDYINIIFIKRVFTFLVGLFIMSLGVALSVKADIGVSPISCVPYIYSLNFSLSIGEFTILINALFMIIQMMILKKDYKLIQLAQFPAIVFFGYYIDIAMVLVDNISVSNYFEQFILCLISCAVLAFGILLIVKAKLTYLPVEGLVIVITQAFNKEFGKIKVTMDSLMILIGVVSSFIFLNELVGIREGSIIAALSIGLLIKVFNSKLPFIEKWLDSDTNKNTNENLKNRYNNNFHITISRQFGSGGHEIGKLLAKQLDIAFYDKELIELTAKNTGYTTKYISDNEQSLNNSLLYDLYEQNFNYVNDELPPKNAIFLVQSKIIREICEKHSAVIVGRCANYILKDHPNCINIFVHANNKYRLNKINKEYKVKPPFTLDDLKKADEKRANYCMHFTNSDWKDARNYHFTIDSSLYGSLKTAQKIKEFIKLLN